MGVHTFHMFCFIFLPCKAYAKAFFHKGSFIADNNQCDNVTIVITGKTDDYSCSLSDNGFYKLTRNTSLNDSLCSMYVLFCAILQQECQIVARYVHPTGQVGG